MQTETDILDHLSTAVLTLDPALAVLSLNSSAQDLLETSTTRCLGQPVERLVADSDALLAMLQQALDTGSPLARRGMPLLLASGREIHVDIMLTPIAGAGSPLVLELQHVDRLLKISREESLVHSQETARAMVRGLAHEIKNPLGGVRGAAQLLARELHDEDLREYTDIIIREADRLRDLVDRLLGPRQVPDLKDLNIHEVLEHVIKLIEAETDNRIQLVRDYDPSLPLLPGDRGQLIQAVLNIVRNALQATEGLDDCRIVLRSRVQRQFTIGAQRHRLVCHLEIEDNGPGVPPDLAQSIFMPMVTGRAEGTGLGLTIAQSIVSRHGGLLECHSEPGCTRFSIYLPLETDNA